MFCPGRVQIDHKESVTNSPILVKCDFYSSLYVFCRLPLLLFLSVCRSVILSVSRSVSLPMSVKSVLQPLCQSVGHSVCLAVFLSVGLSVKSVLKPVCQLFCLSVKSVCQSFVSHSVGLSV